MVQFIADRMKGQDSHSTKDPIYCVQNRRRSYGPTTSSDTCVWVKFDGRPIEADETLAKLIEKYFEHQTEENFDAIQRLDENPNDWQFYGVTDTWETVTVYFTEIGAKHHINQHKHNLIEPRVYVDSGYNNPEWQAIRGFLLGLIDYETVQ